MLRVGCLEAARHTDTHVWSLYGTNIHINVNPCDSRRRGYDCCCKALCCRSCNRIVSASGNIAGQAETQVGVPLL